MTRPTIHTLVTQDLGYCCEWFFFSRFRRTAMLATRLGFTRRAIQYAKARVKNGECQCEGNPRCMKHLLTLR